ncbi:MAG: ral stress protein [Burkholderiales bacterium]|jgi:aryl-alcohol dehydrogenase-like predicted oxidoreductase|nr:ral stress protein [Burkholderiales bacterium]
MFSERIFLPELNKNVSRICLGTWAIGGWKWGGSDDIESIKTIQNSVDMGINIIDTAPVYGFGKSEEIVGKAIKGANIKREDIVIATKGGLDWYHGRLFQNSEPKRITQEVEDSLIRLQTDYIDIYQIHWPDPVVPLEETAQALQILLKQGKIRAVGVSNFSLAQIQEFTQYIKLSTTQPPYNLFERSVENNGIFSYSEKNQIVTLAYRALSGGILSGKIQQSTKFEGDDIRNFDPKYIEPRRSQYLAAVNQLNDYAKDKYNKNILSLAVRWILDRGKYTIAICGARKPAQLNFIDDIENWKLTPDDFEAIDRIVSACIKDPVGPEYMAPPARIEYEI